MSASHELSESIETELRDLATEIAAVRPLVDKLRVADPDEMELRAIAATLHAFYNGVERVFVILAKRFGEMPDQSHAWHRNLLSDMAAATGSRGPVIDDILRDKLRDYLGFRHFFRHAYPMRLKWGLVRPMVLDLHDVHQDLRSQVNTFLSRTSD